MRGSTPGYLYNDYIWFVVHSVIFKSGRRYYVHCIYVYDVKLQFFKKSNLFTFENQEIEYCLGFIVTRNEFIFSYSTWDCTNKILKCEKFFQL